MLLGPIFSIDMLTTARRARHYTLRAIYALALLLVLYLNYHDPYDRRTYSIHEVAAMARNFFQAFAVVQLLAVACLAPALAAGTVALERERRTIEYLFATDLSNAEIVLGQLCSRMLLITSTVLVGLPIMSLAMLFGGIAIERLLVAFVLAMSTALFVASLSMAVSVSTPKARDAVLRCYTILLALWIVPLVLGQAINYWQLPAILGVATDSLELLSPFPALFRMLSSGGALDWSSITGVLAAQAIAATICLTLAVTLVRRIHLHAAGAAPRSTAGWLRMPLQMRRRTVSDRPMLWKELVAPQSKVRLGFFGHLSLTLLAVLALGTSIFALVSITQHARPMASWISAGREYLMDIAPFSDLIACFGGMAISARAAASIAGERERQSWDSLVSSPIEAREIVWAKIWGSLYSARWLVALVGFMWGLVVFIEARLLLAALFSLATLLVILLFGCTLGVFFSAGSSNSLRAMGSTLGTLIFFGGGYLFCCLPPMVGSSGRDGEVVLALCIPYLIVFPVAVNELSAGSHGGVLYLAYILGMFAYGTATIILAAAAILRVRPNESRLPQPQWIGPEAPEESTS